VRVIELAVLFGGDSGSRFRLLLLLVLGSAVASSRREASAVEELEGVYCVCWAEVEYSVEGAW